MRAVTSTILTACVLTVMASGCNNATSKKTPTPDPVAKAPSPAPAEAGEVVLNVPGMH